MAGWAEWATWIAASSHGLNILSKLWAFLPFIRRREQPKAKSGHQFNVVVIMDSPKRKRTRLRRSCFWEYMYDDEKYKTIRDYARVKFMCIADELEEGNNPAWKLFEKDETDIIVVSWNALNGDPAFGADKAQALFKHYIPDIAAWIRKGGIILVEAQHACLVPMQEVYDIFSRCFPGSNIKVTDQHHGIEEPLKINPGNRDHQVLKGVQDNSLSARHDSLGRKIKWFSTIATASIREWTSAHGSVYSGWFETYEGWESLILTRGDHPVMIYRTAGEGNSVGACVLTTMYIASSEFEQLIENLLVHLPLGVRATVGPRAAPSAI
jgi:hypothetical protein